MKLYIGCDHAGYQLKEQIKKYLDERNIDYEELGTFDEKPVDYPDIAKTLAEKVIVSQGQGILICGAANGIAIAANKFRGVRAAVGYSKESAESARYDNDANIICLAGRLQSFKDVREILDAWFDSKFSGDPRHQKRIEKISELEKNG